MRHDHGILRRAVNQKGFLVHRFFCPSGNIAGGLISISDKEQVHHIKDVLRLKINEQVAVFDEKGTEYISCVEKISPKSTLFRVKNKRVPCMLSKVKVAVACAIPKKSKMDDIIDKLTQLGVDRIIPIVTERVIVELDDGKKALRLCRWEKIAQASAKQSQRSNIPAIEPVKEFKKILQEAGDYDLKLIAALSGESKSMREILEKSKAKSILVFIGPEGDFTLDELRLAKDEGCIPVTLGETVLRVETAAVCAASFIKLYF